MKLLQELAEQKDMVYKKSDGYYYFRDKFGKKPQEFGPFETEEMATEYWDVVKWRNEKLNKKRK